MEQMIDFNLEHYISQFKKKKKFQLNSIDSINNLLNSKEYSDFIENLYNFYNSKSHNSEDRLNLQYCSDSGEIIKQFWELLLGKDLKSKFKSHLEIILRS